MQSDETIPVEGEVCWRCAGSYFDIFNWGIWNIWCSPMQKCTTRKNLLTFRLGFSPIKIIFPTRIACLMRTSCLTYRGRHFHKVMRTVAARPLYGCRRALVREFFTLHAVKAVTSDLCELWVGCWCGLCVCVFVSMWSAQHTNGVC